MNNFLDLFNLANAHYLNKRYDEAEQVYKEALQIVPDDKATLTNLILSLYNQNKLDNAIEVFQKLIEVTSQKCNVDFDVAYIKALRATSSLPLPMERRFRFFELIQILKKSLPLPGDIAECGCFRGLSSYLLCSQLKKQKISFDGSEYHIFDSFLGLSPPTEKDEIPDSLDNSKKLKSMCKEGTFSAPLEEVKENLKDFPKISYHPGWIPHSFMPLPEHDYKFVHLDVDLYDPTMDSLQYFYPRLVKGGYIVSDDYGWPGAKKAIQEFCEQEHISFSVNLYNQAIISK